MRWLPLFFIACIEPLPVSYVVNDLRVVAIVADPPDAAPGQKVSLEVTFSAYASVSIHVEVGHCPRRDDFACERNQEIPLGSGEAFSMGPGLFRYSFDYVTGDTPMNEVVLVHGDDGLRPIDALKRVVVSDGAQPRNLNPELYGITVITLDGKLVAKEMEPVFLHKGTTYRALPLYLPERIESFTRVYYDGKTEPAQEEAIMTWSCMPDCVIENETTYGFQTSRITPTADTLSLYVVLRDGRGGEAFTLLDAGVLPAEPGPAAEARR